MITEKVVELLENELIGVPRRSLLAETELATLASWDSVAILVVLAAVEEKFSIILTGKELRNCKTVADLAQLIEKKQ